MSKERMMILEMLENGKITPADAQVLFQALGEEVPSDVDNAPEVDTPYQPEAVSRSEMEQPGESLHPSGEPDRPAPAPAPQPAPAAHSMIRTIAQIFSKPSAPAARDRRRRYPDPSYAVAMKRSGLDFSIDQLFRMEEEDVEPEQAARLVGARHPEWTTDDIVEMLVQGVCPDMVNQLNKLGFGSVSTRDVLQLAEHDIDAEYLERFQGVPTAGLTIRDLIAFYDNDVDPDLVMALKEIGLVTTGDIVKAAENDLSPSSVRYMAQVLHGIRVAGNLVHQMIELSDNDVSPDFIEELARGGFTNLTIKQIINLRENDVDPRDAAWLREKLGEGITPDDLVRLANHDIGRDYVEPLLAFHLPDLSVDTLVKMADHDVSAEDAALAREAYGDGFTAADLIDMADNR